MNLTDPNSDSRPEDAPDEPAAAEPSWAPPDPESYAWPAAGDPLVSMEPVTDEWQTVAPVAPRRPALIPHLGHTAVFFLLLIPSLVGAYIISFLIFLTIIRPHTLHAVMAQIAHEVRYAIGIQAIWYLVLWALAAMVFAIWWRKPLTEGIHWNASAAKRWFFQLGLTGVMLGLLVSIAGNFLPMPKAPPILEDLTKSPMGAWMLMIFGISLAPLTEELAFRGFILPSFINTFRWFEQRGSISESAVRSIGVPVSIVLTSIPFALMHAQQVSFSWGPVLLIGVVSIVLCIVRLRNNSVAAGVVVHACYNLTLFMGLLIQTDGFRHLEKLRG